MRSIPAIALPNGWLPEGIATAPDGTFLRLARQRGRLREACAPVKRPFSFQGRRAAWPSGWITTVAGCSWPAAAPATVTCTTQRQALQIAFYDFTSAASFVNDVIVTRTDAWFTDSLSPVLYRVPLGPDGSPGTQFEVVPLGGDFTFVPGQFNTNGIDATPNGMTLVIVNSAAAKLYTVDPGTVSATEIDLNGGSVPNGDGILLEREDPLCRPEPPQPDRRHRPSSPA